MLRILPQTSGTTSRVSAQYAGSSGEVRFRQHDRQAGRAGLLFQVLERFKNVDLHPNVVDNPTMGTIFEELIRKFNEALNENPGEHFTPRDVVHLMVDLLLAGDEDRIRRKGVVLTVGDPCSGSGGMVTISKDHILGNGGAGSIRTPRSISLARR